MLVADIMTATIRTVRPDSSLTEAVAMLRSHHIRHLIVTDETGLVGIVSDRDVKRAMPSLLEGTTQEAHDQLLNTTTVSRIMTREPARVSASTTVKDALRMMIDHRYGALPVMDGKEVVGIITTTDLLKLLHAMLEDKKESH